MGIVPAALHRRGAVLLGTLLFGAGLALGMNAASASAQDQADHAAADEAFLSGFNELMATIQESDAKIRELEVLAAELEAENRVLVERQLWQRRLDLHASVRALISNIESREAHEQDLSAEKTLLGARLKRDFAAYEKRIDGLEGELRNLRSERDAAAPTEALALEQTLAGVEARVQTLCRVSLELLGMMEAVGVDPSAERDALTTRLVARADGLAGRIELATEELRSIAQQTTGDGDEALQERARATERRLDSVTDALTAILALMAKLDVDSAQYQQLLIETTGELTTGILDAKVVLGLFQSWRERAADQLTTQGPGWLLKAIVFILILIIFWVAGKVVRRLVRRSLQVSKLRLSQLMQENVVAGAARAVMFMGFLVALSQLGVRLGPLLAGLGIAGFVLGFALQDSLSNFAAGAMILLYRPFDVGDAIEAAGVTGKVNRLSLVATTILTFDNQTLIVPNGKIWGDVIRNITAQTRRRVDLVFGVGYADDIEHTESVFKDIVANHDKVLAEPPPVVKLHTLADSSINFIVRPWTRTEDYWDVYWDITREVKLRFDRENISIPFPQRDVHLYKEAEA